MESRITGVLATSAAATPTVSQLDRNSIAAAIAKTGPKLRLHKLELDHHSRMIRFGLGGAMAGGIIGTLSVPHLPHTEATFTVILPLALTYIGLALGFFFAGVRKLVLVKTRAEEFGEVPLTTQGNARGVFHDYNALRDSLSALLTMGINAKQISIVGMDSDALRDATAPLHSKRLDRAVLWLAGIGFLVGAFWGHIACPVVNPSLPSAIISSLMAGFCGAVLGALCGGHIGGIIHLDNTPATEAKMIEGTVDGGLAAVFVSAKDQEQASLARKILNATS